MNIPEHAYAVILAGGGGTRLWPKSRQKHPKHLLKLYGAQSMLQMTYSRMRKLVPAEKILIITHKNHLEEAQKQLPEMSKENWIVEPQAKNTALAIGVAATYVAKRDPEAVILNVHSDQLIKEGDKFLQAAADALTIAAETEYIVTIAIKPAFAHTGLGYIRVGEHLDDTRAFKSRGFKEKPDLPTAQAFLASGQYFWNSGMYSWSVKNLFQEFETHSPQIYSALQDLKDAIDTPQEQQTVEKIYDQAENIAIDVAVSEKAKNLAVVVGDFEWSDIGDWKVMYDHAEKDQKGNAVIPGTNYIGVDTRNTLIEGNQKLIVTIGLDNVVVVETEDAILICNKDKTQDVKKVVEQLKEEKKDQYL